ncbi:MAG: CoA transferase [Actinomycetota bacterium]
MTERFGARVEVDGPALLGERAAIAGFARGGSVSVGGAARFERTADGWIVLNLPRPSDAALLPALVGEAVAVDDWSAIRRLLARDETAVLVERGVELGMAIAAADECPPMVSPGRAITRASSLRRVRSRPLVVDLSSLWAGPLATSLLAAAGARVVKVEARARPDGARQGPAPFFDLLNADKECLAVDFHDPDDLEVFRRLLDAADLVVEASRPRAMAHLGVDPEVLLERSGTSWLSITGYGRVEQPERIGFGDDAAVAGGLWLAGDDAPMFVADAVADPITGLAGAAFAAEILGSERAAVVEVPLVRAAAWANRAPVQAVVGGDDTDGWWVEVDGERVPVAAPHGRTPAGRAAPLDAHGSAIRVEFGAR